MSIFCVLCVIMINVKTYLIIILTCRYNKNENKDYKYFSGFELIKDEIINSCFV